VEKIKGTIKGLGTRDKRQAEKSRQGLPVVRRGMAQIHPRLEPAGYIVPVYIAAKLKNS
jgi:hypothetical protein